MSTHVYYVPSINIMGKGCLQEIGPYIQELKLKKALVVTDKFLMKSGIAGKLLAVLDEAGIEYAIYDEVKPNPTCKNVHDGVDYLKAQNCDYLISIGGGSPGILPKPLVSLPQMAVISKNMKVYTSLSINHCRLSP